MWFFHERLLSIITSSKLKVFVNFKVLSLMEKLRVDFLILCLVPITIELDVEGFTANLLDFNHVIVSSTHFFDMIPPFVEILLNRKV